MFRVIAGVMERRNQQDAEHGGPHHDDTRTWGDWTRFVMKFNDRAAQAISHHDFEDQMFHVAALAVAAIQSSRRIAPEPCNACLGDAGVQHTCRHPTVRNPK